MRVKSVKRYYCDFCKKATLRRPAMEKHELGCTANPQRECGMCKLGGFRQKPIANLNTVLKGITFKTRETKLKALREAANNCPACILAALRQCGESYAAYMEGYDWKTESAAWIKKYGGPFRLSN